MKGFVKVDSNKAKRACDNFDAAIERGKVARKVGIERYHQEVYPERSWFHRWRYRNYEPMAYARAMVAGKWIWGDLSEILWTVLSNDEMEDLQTLENYQEWGSHGSDVRKLVNLNQLNITVGPQLAGFISKWGNV